MRFDATVITRLHGRGAPKSRAFMLTMIVSFVAHGIAVGALALLQGAHAGPVDFQRAIPVQLVRLGKARDPKLLPRKVRPRPAKAKSGVALDIGKAKAASKKPKKKKDRGKAKKDESRDERRVLDSRLDRAFPRLDDENEGDPNGDVRGTTTDLNLAARGYQRAVSLALHGGYRLPEAIPAHQRSYLKARVVLFIARDGRVTRFEFLSRHPNRLFMGALEAMLKTIRLPPPPPKLAHSYANDGVEVVFRP